MIVYQSSKTRFVEDVLNNQIDDIILKSFRRSGRNTRHSEITSWRNSLMYMKNVLEDEEIPGNCGVAIEYCIPQTSKRIDFILTGQNAEGAGQVIVVELKQWEKAKLTSEDAIVETLVGGGARKLLHPSYQAWSYAKLFSQFNEAVYSSGIGLKPCAYLHNYTDDGVISNSFYQNYLDKAPVFFREDMRKLREFIKIFVRRGDEDKLLYRIEKGKIRPSRSLADELASMLEGKPEFLLIDDQKIVFEAALTLIKKAVNGKKQVLIVEGGPGTGKSMVAINLLVEVTRWRKLVHYVSKNAAPRRVYESKLTGKMTRTEYGNLFKGSGSYLKAEPDSMDALIVDEAHWLNEKSGLFKNLGENQIKEIIQASRCAIFFIDEDQRVTLDDIGQTSEITRWANQEGAEITRMELISQFRCNGSDGYLQWLDDVLQIHETGFPRDQDLGFDIRVFDSPGELY